MKTTHLFEALTLLSWIVAPGTALAAEATSTSTTGDEIENVLEVEPKTATPSGTPATTPGHSDNTIGGDLLKLGLEPSLSGYADLTTEVAKGRFDITQGHFNLIVSAKLGDHARAEGEIEFENGGEELKLEYAMFEYIFARELVIQAGKMLVPIGRFNGTLHPSFRWNQVSRPAMFRDVVPAIWSDLGLQAYGLLELSHLHAVWFSAYVIKGLAQPKGVDLTMEVNPIRTLRSNRENNVDKAFGGQVELRLFRDNLGETRVGVSAVTGKYDEAESHRLTILDAHFSMQADALLVRGEIARSMIDGDGFELGAYLQVAYTLGWFTFASRLDYVDEKEYLTRPVRTLAVAPSIMFAPSTFWSLRAELQLPFAEDDSLASPTGLFMLAFGF